MPRLQAKRKFGVSHDIQRMDFESGCLTTWLVSQGERELSGSRRLRLAILQDVILTLARKKNQSWEKEVDEFKDAVRWVNGQYKSLPGCSFEEICIELDYDISVMRRQLSAIARSGRQVSTRLLTMRGRQFGNFRARMSA